MSSSETYRLSSHEACKAIIQIYLRQAKEGGESYCSCIADLGKFE